MVLLPLDGFVIGVTAGRRAAEQGELLARRGAEVVLAPTITTRYLGQDEAVRRATEEVIAGRPDVVLATTGIGVRAWFEAAETWGLGEALVEVLRRSRLFARGPKASAALQVVGLEAHATAASERVAELLERLLAEGVRGRVVAVQHYGKRDGALVEALVAAGATVVEVPVYCYELPENDGRARSLVDAVIAREVDAVTFTSGPAVSNLLELADGRGLGSAVRRAFDDGVLAACIGPVCAESARAAGIRTLVAPDRGRLGLLVRVLSEAFESRRRTLRCGSAAVTVQGRVVAVDGSPARMTLGEATVLRQLLDRPGAVVSKQSLAGAALAQPTTERAVEAAVARLRRRLGPAGDAVRSLRGRGYYLDAEVIAR